MRNHFQTALLTLLFSGIVPFVAVARPFVPTSDDEILEKLPVSPLDPSSDPVRAMRSRLSVQPTDLDTAVRSASEFIERGKRFVDPRFYGYAESALAPWWNLQEPPTPVLLLRADIRQHNHAFESALADLALLLKRDPANAQAWLMQSVVLQVRGRYEEAQKSCAPLVRLTRPLVAASCLASVASLQGSAEQSYDLLRQTLDRSPHADPGSRVWALTVLGEIALRRGDHDSAERDFLAALRIDSADTYLLGAYADLLIDQGRNVEVVSLLGDHRRIDALLLRLVIAEKRSGASEAERDRLDLADRFATARRRGAEVHGREEARFHLEVLEQPIPALALAKENWNLQREPIDARLLLAAAVAAEQPMAAMPVLEFLSQNKTEDVVLNALRERLGRR